MDWKFCAKSLLNLTVPRPSRWSMTQEGSHADPNRALLDERVVCDLLGFDRDTYEAVRRVSAKWCAEPSVHGGKARPRGASLVV